MNKTARADYDFVIENEFLIITDLNYGKMSVTNDIENVLNDIVSSEKIKLSEYKVIYQDSRGRFDGILINPKTEEFEDFFYIGETSIKKAKIMYDVD